MKIDILGHNNFALALLFDIFRESSFKIEDLRIIPNLPQDKNKFREIPFALKEDKYSIFSMEEWEFDKDRKYLIGATAGKTQFTIYNIFKERADFQASDFLNMFHPKSYVSSSSIIGHGIVVEPNASISSFAEISNHVWIKRNVTIGHHARIGAFTNINPGANIAGNSNIGNHCLIGVGTVVNDRVKIGNNCVIGSGSVVTQDIPPNTLAYGVPAKVVKKI